MQHVPADYNMYLYSILLQYNDSKLKNFRACANGFVHLF